MDIYLPIAEMSVNILVLLGMGAVVGYLSGLFGVGGGFLMTPILIFWGVPPAVAVGTQANQVVAASISGMVAHWRRGNVDIKMGLVLLAGGAAGTGLGAWIFKLLRETGQVDLAISLSYVIFLGIIGGLMLVEAVTTIVKRRHQGDGPPPPPKLKKRDRSWLDRLPFRMRFRRSRLHVSALIPLVIGFLVGLLGAIMGVGGGFILLPAMIYLMRMPTQLVIGTSLFQISFVMAIATLLHAINNQTVDMVLALILLVGSVVGAQFGTRMGAKMKGEQLRGLLALLVLLVCGRMGVELVATPADAYSVGSLGAF